MVWCYSNNVLWFNQIFFNITNKNDLGNYRMNERIRELYIQTSNETANGKDWAIGGLHNAERFAQLIVRECARIVTDAVDHCEPASTYADKIKQHFEFGVKDE